jgi:threonine/homoserine/homoserine lactone efflux protein
MDGSLVLQFWIVAVLLALTPGADWAFAIGAGLEARSVVPSILGLLFGYAVVVVAVAVGVGALVSTYPAALTVLTFAGAGYLVFLGVSTLVTTRADPVAASDRQVGQRTLTQFVRGAGVSGVNPKGLLLLLALLPQFTSPSATWAPPLQMGVLGGLHIINCAVVYSSVAVLARRLVRSRPRASTTVTKIAGVLMSVIGVSILVEQVVHLL